MAVGSVRPWPAWVRWTLAVAGGVPAALLAAYAAGYVYIGGMLAVWGPGMP